MATSYGSRLAAVPSCSKNSATKRLAAVPPATTVVLRGSAVIGHRWKDGAPFDADGPGTSDLDLTLCGDQCVELFNLTGFFVPGVHSRPLSDEDPDIAPSPVPLRRALMDMVHRLVNIQASRDIVIQPAAFSERVIACDVVKHPEAAQASDHFPILAELDC